MKKSLTILAFLIAAAASAWAQRTPLAASHARTAPAANASFLAPVAHVNGVTLTERDLQREMQKLFPYTRVHGNRIPGEYSADIRKKALQQIVWDEMVHQEALRLRLNLPEAMLNDILRQAQSRFPDKAAYERYSAQEYGSVRAFQAQLRRGLLIALFLEQELTGKSRVGEAELRKFYSANIQRFKKPASITLQSITINIPENATPAQQAWARKRAEDLQQQAQAAKTYEQFGALAEKYSQDDWRVMMGDHRWVHRGRLPEAIEKVAFAMKPGETSGVISAPGAFVIVRVNGANAEQQIPLAEVRESLQLELQRAKEADLRARLEARLRKTFKVEAL